MSQSIVGRIWVRGKQKRQSCPIYALGRFYHNYGKVKIPSNGESLALSQFEYQSSFIMENYWTKHGILRLRMCSSGLKFKIRR